MRWTNFNANFSKNIRNLFFWEGCCNQFHVKHSEMPSIKFWIFFVYVFKCMYCIYVCVCLRCCDVDAIYSKIWMPQIGFLKVLDWIYLKTALTIEFAGSPSEGVAITRPALPTAQSFCSRNLTVDSVSLEWVAAL